MKKSTKNLKALIMGMDMSLYQRSLAVQEWHIFSEYVDSLKEHNSDLESKILIWHKEHGEDKEFAEFFGISAVRTGKIE